MCITRVPYTTAPIMTVWMDMLPVSDWSVIFTQPLTCNTGGSAPQCLEVGPVANSRALGEMCVGF